MWKPFLFLLAGTVAAKAADLPEVARVCEPGLNFPGGDLDSKPQPTADAADCRRLCQAHDGCNLFTFHVPRCSYHGETCALPSEAVPGKGCCYLKAREVPGHAPACNNCTCSAWVRTPPSSFRPTHRPPAAPRHILYLLVDDLRPEIEPYLHENDTKVLRSPSMKRLADKGAVFDRAYCQVS